MENKANMRKELEDYVKAQESQLDLVQSASIGTEDYFLPTTGEIDETVFLEGEIEAAQDMIDFLDDEDDEVLRKFFET